jgi:hypothetical protein
VREIRTLRVMWLALETGSSLKIYAPARSTLPPSIMRNSLTLRARFASRNFRRHGGNF